MRSISVIVSVIALSFNASAQQPAGRRGVSPEDRQKIESAPAGESTRQAPQAEKAARD